MASLNRGGMTGTELRNSFGPAATEATRVSVVSIKTASKYPTNATVTRSFLILLLVISVISFFLNKKSIRPISPGHLNFINFIGVITDKIYLPITQLNFGGTQLANSSGIFKLGRFECSGQASVSAAVPKSCFDLWKDGHTKSGIYQVMGSKYVETIYCDFARLPHQPGKTTSHIPIQRNRSVVHKLIILLNNTIIRLSKVDWILRCEIVASPFLCAKE